MNIEEYCYDKYIKSGDIVYDIGAHVGRTSVLFAQKGAKKIYAFEPSVFNIQELKNNTLLYSNIEIFNVALHELSEDCVTRFRDCRVDSETDREQPIKYVVLKKFIEESNLELPNFIKMDIEGMESLVLKTFDFLFTGCRPIVFVEIHAAPENEPQNYIKNPHWKYIDQGGFDMNTLKSYDYLCIRKDLDLSENRDYNPRIGAHEGAILLQKEKL